MLNKIIYFSIKNKFIIGLFTLGLIFLGVYSATKLPIDALPDITNNQVQILTTSPTLATQEVEKFITYPIERELKSIPDIVELRSVSRFGLSLVTVVFEEDIDIYWARNQINERLKSAEENIPKGFGTPELAPVSTGLGEIYQYTVYADSNYFEEYNAMDLRSIQDWIIVPQLLGTKGVAEVNTLGGKLKEYEISVVPDRLKSMKVTMSEIFEALENNNENTGGAYIDKKPNAYYIRGIGMVNNLDDIKKIVVKVENEIPILIRDIATVQFGSAIRYGAATKDGKGEVVSGMVMMLKGENSAEVVSLVKEKIEKIKENLPIGVNIEPFLDRTKLVNNAIGTVQKNLIEGALIVIFILVLLIGNWRAGLIVASVIPLSLLFAISLMKFFGVSGNLMSLGAIDFGLIVDGAVIIVEAIVHNLQKFNSKKKLNANEMDEAVYQSASKIRTSAAFGEIIILIVYLPILVLVGIEGKMFGPMAQTVSFAILGAFILSLTYVPMMSALFLSKRTSNKVTFSDKIIDFINRYYQRLLKRALKLKGLVVSVSLLLFIGAIVLFSSLGGEFIPTLEEGDIATHIIIPPGSSLEQEIEMTTKAEKLLMANFPEIEQAVSKIGSAEVPTDPMPMEVADVMLIMKPKKEWTSAKSKEEMMEKMDAVLADLPGVTTEFTQPIQMRFNELMTGVRSDVGIKIFGEDIDLLVGFGDEVVEIINKLDGVVDPRAERVSGLPQITVKYNKDKLALYGLNVGDLNQSLRMGFAGEKAGVIYEGEKKYDMVVRLEKSSRDEIDDIKNLYISLPSGSQIPMSQVADIKLERGPAQISREQGKRRIIVGFNVRNRDVQTVVNEIQIKLKDKLHLPAGYYTEYAGQFENLIEANKRLSVAVPIALAFILVLLFFTFKDLKQSLLIFTAIPLSAIGGVAALWLRDMPFSISAGVGFIALFGVSVLNGIVLIAYFNQLKEEGMDDIIDRIKEGTKVRLRPVIMTASVASLGFLPMALSNSAGAEVQKPLATVVIGGLITATFLTLIVLPILYYFLERYNLKFNIKKSGLALLVLTLCSFNSFSQTEMTLEKAISIGLENNIKLKNGLLNIELQNQKLKTAKTQPKAEILATYGQLNSFEFDQSYSFTQTFNPFIISAKRQLQNEYIIDSELKFQDDKLALTYQIKSVWNNIIYLSNLKSMVTSQDSLNLKFKKHAEMKHALGEINEIEKTTIDLHYLKFNIQIQKIDVKLNNSKNQLMQLINDYTLFVIPREKLVQSEVFIDSIAVENNLQLKLALQAIEIAKQNEKLNKSTFYPDITAGYFMQSMQGTQIINGSAVKHTLNPNFNGFSIGLNIPIFASGIKTESSILKTKRIVRENDYDLLKSELESQLNSYLKEKVFLEKQLKFYRNTALRSNINLINKAAKGYLSGETDYVEYGQLLKMNLETQHEYLDIIYAYNQVIYSIQYLLNQ